MTGPLVGVDLSVKMLERAAALQQEGGGAKVYDALLSQDLLALQPSDVLSRAAGGATGGARECCPHAVVAAL